MLIEVRLTKVAFSKKLRSRAVKKPKGKTPKHRIGTPKAGCRINSPVTVTRFRVLSYQCIYHKGVIFPVCVLHLIVDLTNRLFCLHKEFIISKEKSL
jgi:hypothetical protein